MPATARETKIQPKPRSNGFSAYLSISRGMLPAVAGLAIAQAALAVSVYGNASYAESPITPNLSAVVAAPPLIALIVFLGASHKHLGKRAARALACIGMALQTLCPLGMVAADMLGTGTGVSLALSAAAVAGNMLTVTFWLSRIKHHSPQAVALTTFSAVAASEVVSFALAFSPHGTACLAASLLSAANIPLAAFGAKRLAKGSGTNGIATRGEAGKGDPTPASEYLKLMESRSDDVGFLAPSLLAAIIVSVVVGLLWGFPDGHANVLSIPGRAACAASAIAAALLVARRLGAPVKSGGPAGPWIAIQLFALGSLILYTLAPELPVLGMMCLYALNAVASAFMWCVACALMRNGSFDSHCYGLGALMTFILPGSMARVAMIFAVGSQPGAALQFPHFHCDALVAGILGMLILLPVQLIMAASQRVRRSDEARMDRLLKGMTRALGLSGDITDPVDARRALMEEAAAEMKDAFGLSGRETDVLTLYALGMTQNKIAEELHVSVSTAHTHITHIYSKTGAHSRQELIDLIDARADPKLG